MSESYMRCDLNYIPSCFKSAHLFLRGKDQGMANNRRRSGVLTQLKLSMYLRTYYLLIDGSDHSLFAH